MNIVIVNCKVQACLCRQTGEDACTDVKEVGVSVLADTNTIILYHIKIKVT